jgi:hypothetical protein
MVILSKKRNVQKSYYDFIWPISRSVSSDEMNSSYGPRIKYILWQQHNGIDLPNPIGTPVYTSHDGEIYLAGPADPPTWNSNHVVIKLTLKKENSKPLFLLYLHLSKIADGIEKGIEVQKGDYIGNTGSDESGYKHLHFEVRTADNDGGLGNRRQTLHPLKYLPYVDSVNFGGELKAIYQKNHDQTIKAMLTFGAQNKNEGDLLGVEVQLFKNNSMIDDPKIVDFENEATIDKSGENNDNLIYNKLGIGVEGYQEPNMNSKNYTDLHYGILIRNIPNYCDMLSTKVFDVGGNVITWSDIPISQPSTIEQSLDFEDAMMPPPGWTVTRSNIPNIQVSNESTSAYSGTRGMFARIGKSNACRSHAAIENNLLYNNYFEFTLKAMIQPFELELNNGAYIYPIYFLDGRNLSIAAGIHRNENNDLAVRLVAKDADGKIRHSENNENSIISDGEWLGWSLVLRRVHTRVTTARLYLCGNDNSVSSKAAAIVYDSRAYKPKRLRIGIVCSPNCSGTMNIDMFSINSRV